MKAKTFKKLLTSIAGGALGAILLSFMPGKHAPILPRDKIVRIRGEYGMCSGEQIEAPSGTTYILSAGHCRKLADPSGMFTIITEDHKSIQRKLIVEDPNSDLLLIEGLPSKEGIKIAARSYPGENVTTLTHGGNLDTYTTKGVLIQMSHMLVPVYPITSQEDREKCTSMPKNSVQNAGFEEFCCLDIFETVSTALIVPGSSGGALLDSRMQLVGVASAGDGTFSSFVSLKDIHELLNNY